MGNSSSNVSQPTVVGTPAGKGRRGQLVLSTWNLEGLSEVKLHEVCTYMRTNSIDILCIQETRKLKSDYYETLDGYAVYLSGSGDGVREWAGVGFIVSSKFRQQIIGFNPICNRIAYLKVQVLGGCCAVFCLYAPHNLKNQHERIAF